MTAILEHFGVYIVGESKILFDDGDSKIDVDVIHKIGFFRDPTDMIYKHHSYITTRMDTFDAANQQVQAELRRLSNRLDYMNLDDDNVESKS
ncbi:hypothetical protein Lal_00039859 [Lupinus albus]|nr:hypothetical protein Lal_00039859 [Lupinus albus]